MTFFHRDKNSAAGRADFSAAAQRSFNRRAIAGQIDNVRGKMKPDRSSASAAAA